MHNGQVLRFDFPFWRNWTQEKRKHFNVRYLSYKPLTINWAVKFVASAAFVAIQVYVPLCTAFKLKKSILLLKTLFWTCTSVAGSNNWPSFSHFISIGISPEEIVQDTWDRSPSFRSPSKVNGDILGGSIAFSRIWAVAWSPWVLKAVQEYFLESSFSTARISSVPLLSGAGRGPFSTLEFIFHWTLSIG